MSAFRSLLYSLTGDFKQELREYIVHIGKALADCSQTLATGRSKHRALESTAIDGQTIEIKLHLTVLLQVPRAKVDLNFPSVNAIEFQVMCLAELQVTERSLSKHGKEEDDSRNAMVSTDVIASAIDQNVISYVRTFTEHDSMVESTIRKVLSQKHTFAFDAFADFTFTLANPTPMLDLTEVEEDCNLDEEFNSNSMDPGEKVSEVTMSEEEDSKAKIAKMVEDVAKVSAERDYFRTILESCEQENTTYEHELKLANRRMDQMEDDKLNLTRELNSAHTRIDDLVRERSEKDCLIRLAQGQVAQLQEEMERRLEKANELLMQTEWERNALRKRVEEVEEDLQQQKTITKGLEDTLRMVESERDAKMSRVESELAALMIELDRANEQIETMAAERAAMQACQNAATEPQIVIYEEAIVQSELRLLENPEKLNQEGDCVTVLKQLSPNSIVTITSNSKAKLVEVDTNCKTPRKVDHDADAFSSPLQIETKGAESYSLYESPAYPNVVRDNDRQQSVTKAPPKKPKSLLERKIFAISIPTKDTAPIPGAFKRGLTQLNATPTGGHTRKVRVIRKHRYGLNKRQKLQDTLHPEMHENGENCDESS